MQSEEIVYDLLLELKAVGERDVAINQKMLNIHWIDQLLEECSPEIEDYDEE